MNASVAFECFADQDVFRLLAELAPWKLLPCHSFSQGEVINDVYVKNRATIGIVDEDPQSSHHGIRDSLTPVKELIDFRDIEVRSSAGRYLLIVRPDLEKCFFTGMKRVGLKPESKDPETLHRVLGQPNRRVHEKFRNELKLLHERSTERNIPCFTTELTQALRAILK